METLLINEELKNLLPPLSAKELAGLEESIMKHGCLSPMIVWNGILVDGHHRYEICTKREIPFSVQNIVFDDLDAAKLWAWKHQEHRRNLTKYLRAELALKLKDTIAAKAKEQQKASGGDRKSEQAKSVCQNSDKPITVDTKKELATIAEVSHDTLVKAAYIAEHADEETKEKLRRGEKGTSINKEFNRLKDEEKNAGQEPQDESLFRPGSLPTKKYVGETQLKPIPRDRPDILVGNLIAFFPQEFVPNTAREIFRMLHDRYGIEVTKPLAIELYQQYGRRKK